jgi:hypothetical protein
MFHHCSARVVLFLILKVADTAAFGPLHKLAPFVITTFNLTVSLYCCEIGVTVSVDVVDAAFTVTVNDLLAVLPHASVAV